jgi:hypothetical protein
MVKRYSVSNTRNIFQSSPMESVLVTSEKRIKRRQVLQNVYQQRELHVISSLRRRCMYLIRQKQTS